MTRARLLSLRQGLAFFLVLLAAACADGLAAYGPPGWIALGAVLLLALVLVEPPRRAKRKRPLVLQHKQAHRRTSLREDMIIIADKLAFDKR